MEDLGVRKACCNGVGHIVCRHRVLVSSASCRVPAHAWLLGFFDG
jgi:hypothetical protein